MKMKVNVYASLVLLCVSISLITGCFSKNDLRKPIGNVLKTQYGIEDFKILSTTNNWFEGVSHDTVIEIEKPYYTVSHFFVERNTYELYEETILEDILKGAFVAQFPEVIQVSEEIMKQYQFEATLPQLQSDETKSFHYYLQFHLEDQQKLELAQSLKENQAIDVSTVVPNLTRVKPGDGESLYWQAPVNLIYDFNVANHTGDVPQAATIATQFQQSGLLPAGIYHVVVRPMFFDNTQISYGMHGQDSNVVFAIDNSGVVTELEVYPTGF
jgi:hypothetical protein